MAKISALGIDYDYDVYAKSGKRNAKSDLKEAKPKKHKKVNTKTK